MPKVIKVHIVVIALLYSGILNAQEVLLKGQLKANEDVDGIHILNKTFLKFTITDTDGSFKILVRVGDTLTISSLRYQLKEVRVDQQILDDGTLKVQLEEKINELDEVLVGKILTGRLDSDLANFNVKQDINFYDLGIPGYKGKPKTKQQRLLNEATTGGGFIPLNPILNWISGRTKRLKGNIRLEKNEVCLRQFRDAYEEGLFEKEPLEEDLKIEYFYFCSESEEFSELCDRKDPITMIDFFNEKLKIFKANAALREEVKNVREFEETSKN